MMSSSSRPVVKRLMEKVWLSPQSVGKFASLSHPQKLRLQRMVLSRSERPSLQVDALESRFALAVDAPQWSDPAVVTIAAEFQVFESPNPGEINPAEIPVFAGPGDNYVVEIIPPADIAPSAIDPTRIPAFIGPGDNQVVYIGPSTGSPNVDPRDIPVFAGPGENQILAIDPTVFATINSQFRDQTASIIAAAEELSGTGPVTNSDELENDAPDQNAEAGVPDPSRSQSPRAGDRTRPVAGSDGSQPTSSNASATTGDDAFSMSVPTTEQVSATQSASPSPDDSVMPHVMNETIVDPFLVDWMETFEIAAPVLAAPETDQATPASHITENDESSVGEARQILPQVAGLGLLGGQMLRVKRKNGSTQKPRS